MKIVVHNHRSTLISKDGLVDIHEGSNGTFSSRIEDLYPVWNEFAKWAAPFGVGEYDEQLFERANLGPVTPKPSQILAVGLNYVDHAAESGFQVPEYPIVFTKFQSSITGPFGDLKLTSDTVDWEVEMVAVIGKGGRNIPADQAWDHIAGLTIGQDYSDRDAQFRGHPAQFSLGKSFPGFAPIGPLLVTPDEFLAQDNPMIECEIDGKVMQSAPVSDMVFSVPTLIEMLSAVVELYPGDAIFTGTPPGVGLGHTPPRYLRAGECVVSRISGLGSMEQICV